MHALIVGSRGVGKSTLIRRCLKALNRPVFGFETRKEEAWEDPILGCPIYIYDAGKPHCRTQEHFLGYHRQPDPAAITAAFDRFAPKLAGPMPEGCLVELDEIGFLEAGSRHFCQAVLKLLEGDRPVLAAVKNKDIPFLHAIRSHPNARCFFITEENREELFEEVLAFLKQQLEECP